LPVRAARAKVFLTVQGVAGEDDAAEAEVPDHRPDRLGLGGHVRHLLVAEDQGRVGGEGAEHVGRGAVVQAVEAAPQGLAIQRHGGVRSIRPALAQLPGVAAEGGLQRLGIEREEQVAQRVDRRRAAQADAVDVAEPVAVHGQEGHDAAGGGRAREHGQDREQQQMGQRVARALGAARVGDPLQGGEQGGERHHGDLRQVDCRFNTSAAGRVPPQPASTEQPWQATEHSQ
jgi:hypothetical protein